MQTIVTKTLNPTQKLGTRVRAKAAAMAVTFAWNHALSEAENHRNAAENYSEMMRWDYPIVSGANPDGKTWSHIPICSMMPAPIKGSGGARKYRPSQIDRVRSAMGANTDRGTLTVMAPDGTRSKALSVTRSDLAGLIEIFNQNDDD